MDDLGYGDMGFTGHPTTKTPNIDKLAYNGKILTTWYSGCNVCTGSRAALMTGRQFPRTGLPGVLGATEKIGLPLNETTLAEHLKHQAGYATGIVGKWHLGQRKVYLPANRGFDFYLGMVFQFSNALIIQIVD
jgi:arylsulfatase A